MLSSVDARRPIVGDEAVIRFVEAALLQCHDHDRVHERVAPALRLTSSPGKSCQVTHHYELIDMPPRGHRLLLHDGSVHVEEERAGPHQRTEREKCYAEG